MVDTLLVHNLMLDDDGCPASCKCSTCKISLRKSKTRETSKYSVSKKKLPVPIFIETMCVHVSLLPRDVIFAKKGLNVNKY